jgi:polyhydroxybutyrate depolymerase
MKKGNLLICTSISLLLLIISIQAKAQKQVNDSIDYQNLSRKYSIYIPKLYSEKNRNPLVLNFHGTGGNGAEFLLQSNLTGVADTAGFLVVSPTATNIMGGNWNWYKPEVTGVDDPAFISALLDTIIENYNIDANRIYCTGESRGGIFCYALACKLSNRIAAIAPVVATMLTKDIETCIPSHPIPVLHIHGTHDSIVPYLGKKPHLLPVPTVLDFWCNFNSGNKKTSLTIFCDYDISNEHNETILCESGNNGATVKLLKIYKGGHGILRLNYEENNNCSISAEVWKFFYRYSLDQL